MAAVTDEVRARAMRPSSGLVESAKMKRSTMLIGVSVAAATLAATFQFAGGLGGDAPASGGTVVGSTAAKSSSTSPRSTVRITAPPVTIPPTSTVPDTTVPPTTNEVTTTSVPLIDDSIREVLAVLNGLVVADPDLTRTPYDRDTYQPEGWADLDGD